MTYEVEFEILPSVYELLNSAPDQIARREEMDKVSETTVTFIFSCLDVIDQAKEFVLLYTCILTCRNQPAALPFPNHLTLIDRGTPEPLLQALQRCFRGHERAHCMLSFGCLDSPMIDSGFLGTMPISFRTRDLTTVKSNSYYVIEFQLSFSNNSVGLRKNRWASLFPSNCVKWLLFG